MHPKVGQYNHFSDFDVASELPDNSWESSNGVLGSLVIIAVFQEHVNVSNASGAVYWTVFQEIPKSFERLK